ncbi:hypothetical protein [Candidatus Uabimicrobium sp. HlEnr_7]|uniref:hypothetical protein n=1 Tax=Candidatus Uabimicrobium helgolandensis TaxID=3095367 RepID=UPI00355922EE
MIKIRRNKKFKVAVTTQGWINKISSMAQEKDYSRVKFVLEKNVIKEKDAIDAICSQILENNDKTLIRILFERRILYKRRYKFLLKLPLKKFANRKNKDISRKNFYIGNVLVEYDVVSREQVGKYLQILHKMEQIGLDGSWNIFAAKTKLISEDVLLAILDRIQEKVATFEIKQNSIGNILRSQKITFSLTAKLFLVSITFALLFFPLLLISIASYETIIGEAEAPPLDLTPKIYSQVTISKKVEIKNNKLDKEKYFAVRENRLWGNEFITASQWEELAKKFPPNQFPNTIPELAIIDVKYSKNMVIISGKLDAPFMPVDLRLKPFVVLRKWQSEEFIAKEISLDKENQFKITIEQTLATGHYELLLQLKKIDQPSFTKKFINSSNQTWMVLMQIGSDSLIIQKQQQEKQKLMEYISLLKKQSQNQEDITQIAKTVSLQKFIFINDSKPFAMLISILNKQKDNKNINDRKFLVNLCRVEIEILKYKYQVQKKHYFKVFFLQN